MALRHRKRVYYTRLLQKELKKTQKIRRARYSTKTLLFFTPTSFDSSLFSLEIPLGSSRLLKENASDILENLV
jgi:hypothetical protein